ncbi:IPT/TIG domain-containing protein [Nocardia abscessus]|uniref:IPT/TIG domain-containing protein n=1 Tax=Nocardia abscessus TaxID=120957 RepID=UPI003CC7DF0F
MPAIRRRAPVHLYRFRVGEIGGHGGTHRITTTTTGGTSVTITGTGFTGPATVSFGGTATTFTIDSPTQITAIAPAGSAGAVQVTVTNSDGTSNGVTYTYLAVPALGSIAPGQGSTSSGTSVLRPQLHLRLIEAVRGPSPEYRRRLSRLRIHGSSDEPLVSRCPADGLAVPRRALWPSGFRSSASTAEDTARGSGGRRSRELRCTKAGRCHRAGAPVTGQFVATIWKTDKNGSPDALPRR